MVVLALNSIHETVITDGEKLVSMKKEKLQIVQIFWSNRISSYCTKKLVTNSCSLIIDHVLGVRIEICRSGDSLYTHSSICFFVRGCI